MTKLYTSQKRGNSSSQKTGVAQFSLKSSGAKTSQGAINDGDVNLYFDYTIILNSSRLKISIRFLLNFDTLIHYERLAML